MTKELDQFLSEFDEEPGKKRKDSSATPESLTEAAFDDDLLNPDTGTGSDSLSPEPEPGRFSYESETEPVPDLNPADTGITEISDSMPESEIFPEQTGKDEKVFPEQLPADRAENLIPGIPGARSWNTRPPYVLTLTQSDLDADIAALETSFYVVQSQIPREQLSAELKRSLLKYLKKQISSIDNIYREIVNRAILLESEKLLGYFSIDPEKQKMFMYHLGITTVHSLVLWRFKNTGTGYCYRYGTDGKAIRFFPESFLKKVVVDWYQDNIYSLNLPFDSLQVYDSFKNLVSKRYIEEDREFRSRLDKINQKVDPSRRITADKLMKLKGGEWYDQACILSYRRFLGRTIFS